METNTKHTSGPWLFRAKNDSVWTTPPAGSLYKFGDHIFTFHDEDGPSDEDLSLILAAPELLQVAICLLFVVRAMARELDIDPETTEFRFSAKGEHVAELNLQTVYERADETIAKATGSAA